ncbi:MAG: hypothetical protein KY469_20020 [Actinobacteria bacterium]|nr:hypothetical protein [Actinomycetota bacterium]
MAEARGGHGEHELVDVRGPHREGDVHRRAGESAADANSDPADERMRDVGGIECSTRVQQGDELVVLGRRGASGEEAVTRREAGDLGDDVRRTDHTVRSR